MSFVDSPVFLSLRAAGFVAENNGSSHGLIASPGFTLKPRRLQHPQQQAVVTTSGNPLGLFCSPTLEAKEANHGGACQLSTRTRPMRFYAFDGSALATSSTQSSLFRPDNVPELFTFKVLFRPEIRFPLPSPFLPCRFRFVSKLPQRSASKAYPLREAVSCNACCHPKQVPYPLGFLPL